MQYTPPAGIRSSAERNDPSPPAPIVATARTTHVFPSRADRYIERPVAIDFMKLSTFRPDHSPGIRAVLAIALCCGGVRAASLLAATPGTVALTCNTITGPGAAATVVVKPVATLGSTNTIAVTLGLGTANGGLAVASPGSTILNASNQSQGLTYIVNLSPGCAGATNGATTLRFYAGGVADVAVTAATSVIATATPLVASPVTLNCAKVAGPPVSYTVGLTQSVSVNSAAVGGTPFAVDPSTTPAWAALAWRPPRC